MRKLIAGLLLTLSFPSFACEDNRVKSAVRFQKECMAHLVNNPQGMLHYQPCKVFTGIMNTATIESMFQEFDKGTGCYVELGNLTTNYLSIQRYVFGRKEKIKI